MRKCLLLLIIHLALGGCATFNEPGGMLYRSAQEKKLGKAVELLEQGKGPEAGEVLAGVIADPGVPGVTDEALFRLSLIHLGSGHDRSGITKARHDLERLKKEYPTGAWALLASTLNDALAAAEAAQLQNRRLKDLNLSLTKDNKEFRQNIEKLRNLELELGRGKRR